MATRGSTIRSTAVARPIRTVRLRTSTAEPRVAIQCRIARTMLARTSLGRIQLGTAVIPRPLERWIEAAAIVVIRRRPEPWIAAAIATGAPREPAAAIASATAMSQVPEVGAALSAVVAVAQRAPAARADLQAWAAEVAGAAEAAGDSETNDGHQGNHPERI